MTYKQRAEQQHQWEPLPTWELREHRSVLHDVDVELKAMKRHLRRAVVGLVLCGVGLTIQFVALASR